MSFESLSGLVSEAEHTSIFDAVIDEDVRDRQVTRDESFASMRKLYAAMKAADAAYVPEERSASGLVGGDGARFAGYAAAGDTLCGDFMAQVIARALRMGECNACMKRIVAAPTAGSCGVLPAVLVPLQLRMALSDDDMIRALFVAGGVGQVIAHRAFIAGAAGGCQAEVGTAATHKPARMRAPWRSRTSWGWCAIRWQGWWRCRASSATSSARPARSPARIWRLPVSAARFRRTR